MTNPSAKLIEELIESARLLGATQAKRGFGVYTQEDAMIEQAFHESIDKKTRTLCAELARSEGFEWPACKACGGSLWKCMACHPEPTHAWHDAPTCIERDKENTVLAALDSGAGGSD